MTLVDIYNQIINYDLMNLRKDLIIPGIKLIVFFGVVFFLLIGSIFVVFYLFLELKKLLKRRTVKVDKNPMKIDRKDWVKVDNREGLYCYYCTKKLNLSSWKNLENYYCDVCHEKLLNTDS